MTKIKVIRYLAYIYTSKLFFLTIILGFYSKLIGYWQIKLSKTNGFDFYVRAAINLWFLWRVWKWILLLYYCHLLYSLNADQKKKKMNEWHMLTKLIKINEYIDDIYKWNESATISLQTIMTDRVSHHVIISYYTIKYICQILLLNI